MPLIDASKCVECGLCEKRCHVLNRPQQELSKQKTYAVINYEDRKLSSSGGAFSMFARYVLGKGGVVFGAAFDPFPHLKHIAIESLENLDKLRGSKYVQSEIGDTYKQVKELLKTDRMILYTGTPCQIEVFMLFLAVTVMKVSLSRSTLCAMVCQIKPLSEHIWKNSKKQNISTQQSRGISVGSAFVTLTAGR